MKIANKLTTGGQQHAIKAIVVKLLEAELTLQVIHLQAKTKNGWEHTALGSLYESIPGFIDNLVEKSYAKVGMITGYGSVTIQEDVESITYVKGLLDVLEKNRASITSGYLQQITDNIIEAVAHTIYKLENIK